MTTKSEPGFTPGPWLIATSCSWRRIVSESGNPVCAPTIQRSDNHPDLHFPNGGESGPDAHLIASAPELYAALDEAVKDLVAYQVNSRIAAKKDPAWEGVAEIIQPTIDAARAALAKAKGEHHEK